MSYFVPGVTAVQLDTHTTAIRKVLEDAGSQTCAIMCFRAFSEFVDDDKASVCGHCERESCLLQVDHESALDPGNALSGGDAGQDLVCETNRCGFCGNEATDMRHVRDHCDLLQVDTLTRVVWTGHQDHAWTFDLRVGGFRSRAVSPGRRTRHGL